MKEVVGGILILLVVVAIVVVVSLPGLLIDQSTAVKALETQGFSNVEITGRQWIAVSLFGCSSDDAAKFDVVAINPVGKQVEVYVCAGWPFKGATVRTK